MPQEILSEGHSRLVFILSDSVFFHTPPLEHKQTSTAAAHPPPPLFPTLLSSSFFPALFPPNTALFTITLQDRTSTLLCPLLPEATFICVYACVCEAGFF